MHVAFWADCLAPFKESSEILDDVRSLHNAAGAGGAVCYKFRVQAAKALGHVAVPADWLMCIKNLGKLFGTNSLPLSGLEIGPDQSGRVIEMAERRDWLLAEYALLAFVPVGHNVPHEAVFRIDFDLIDAFLAAVLAFGPAGTFFKAYGGLDEEGAERGLSGIHIDGFGLVGFRAGNEPLAAEIEVSTHCRECAHQEESCTNDQNGDDDGKNGDCHGHLQSLTRPDAGILRWDGGLMLV